MEQRLYRLYTLTREETSLLFQWLAQEAAFEAIISSLPRSRQDPLSEKMSVKYFGARPLEFIRACPAAPAAQEHKLVFRLLSISFSESFLFLRERGDPGRRAEHPANINCVGKGIENLAARGDCGDTVEEMSDHRKIDIHPNKGTSIHRYLVDGYMLTGHSLTQPVTP